MKTLTAQELRIGNWVQHEPHPYEQWQVDFKLLEAIYDKSIYTVGIPLTEEWLIKFGFSRVTIFNRSYFLKYHNLTQYAFKIGNYPVDNPNVGYLNIYQPEEKNIAMPNEHDLNAVMTFEERITGISWGIAYVHQLQNLYYALTGEELTHA